MPTFVSNEHLNTHIGFRKRKPFGALSRARTLIIICGICDYIATLQATSLALTDDVQYNTRVCVCACECVCGFIHEHGELREGGCRGGMKFR